jgi:hypothetical protein
MTHYRKPPAASTTTHRRPYDPFKNLGFGAESLLAADYPWLDGGRAARDEERDVAALLAELDEPLTPGEHLIDLSGDADEPPPLDDPARTVLVPPPTPAEKTAAQALAQVEAIVRALLEGHLERAADCGQIVRTLKDRESSRGRGMSRHCRCKRCRGCPLCWAHHRRDKMLRAAKAILATSPHDPTPRQTNLWLLTTTWKRWKADGAALRRRSRRQPVPWGYLRVRAVSGEVVVVCEGQLPGAVAVRPAEATLLVADLVRDQLARLPKAFLLCGRWRQKRRPGRWELVKTALTPAEVRDLAAQCGAAVKSLDPVGPFTGEGYGFSFPPDVDAATVALFWDAVRVRLSSEPSSERRTRTRSTGTAGTGSCGAREGVAQGGG